MIRCQKCGGTLPPHARFCSICGAEAVPASPQNATGTQTAMPTNGQTQNINATQGFGRTSQFGGTGELGATTAFVAPGGGVSDAEAENKKRTAIMLGGSAGLLLVAGLIWGAYGLLGAKKPTTGGAAVLSAPPAQVTQAPVLTAPAPSVATAPVITAPPAQGNPMPEDVIAYLRWLKQFEAGRIALESKSEAQMMLVMQELIKVGMAGTASMGLLEGDSEEASKNPQPKTAIDTGAVNAVIADWNTATGIFQAKSPPNSCATLASHYNMGLTSSVTAMSQILGKGVAAIESINGANGQKTGEATDVLSFLTDQKNNASLSKNIEASFATSNQSLDALRSQYTEIPADIDKGQFSIKSGSAGGINIPIPGMGM